MNENGLTSTYQRSESKRRFLTRFYRYKVLLFDKWWIPLLAIGLCMGTAGTVCSFHAPSFTSVGRMIVSIKLAIPEGSVYAEEMSAFLGTQTALMQSDLVVNRAWARVAAQITNTSLQSIGL